MQEAVGQDHTQALKASILAHVERISSEPDAEMYLRSRYCGGKFDVDGIVEKGFHVLASGEQGKTLGLIVNSQKSQHEIRLHFGPKRHLRDARFFVLNKNAKVELIRSMDCANSELCGLASDILSECTIDSIPETALLDFESLRDNFSVSEKHQSETWERQLCIIWQARLEHWATAHPPTAARYIATAARHPEFCQSGVALAGAAFHAQNLHMHGEAAIILKAALKQHADDADSYYWNLIGCILDRLGALELSVSCFLEVIKTNPAEETGRKNAWLVGRTLIKRRLETREFRDSLEDIDHLMAHHEGVEEQDRALMMAATGLCCEGFGLLEEAGERYKAALEIKEDCLVARFGANRVTSENAEERLRHFELQLTSFPRLPHELGIGDKVPVEFIEGYGHGDHWNSVTSDAKTFLQNYLPTALEKAEPRGLAKYDAATRVNRNADAAVFFAFPPKGEIQGGSLAVKTPSVENLELWSAYPFATKGEAIRLKVASLEEWENGVEGSVVARRGGGGSLTFFDPFFFENKTEYLKDHEYEFILSGFVYSIKKTDPIVHKISSGSGYEMERHRRQLEGRPMADGETFDVELGSNSTLMIDQLQYPGEYEFLLPVEDVRHLDFLGESILAMRSHINDDARNIPLTIYVAKRLLDESAVAPGDLITGYLWLQGLLLSLDGTPVAREDAEDRSRRFGKMSYKRQESESMADEFNYIFSRALDTIDTIRCFADLPFRIGDEPDYVVEGVNGIRAFIRSVHFDMESDTWEEKRAQAQLAMEHPWIASRFSPLFILGVGYTKVGEGHALTYFGWEEFEAALAK